MSAAEKRYLARDEESEGVEVAHSRGSYLIDARGTKYIDFVMGWCVGNLGWNSVATRAAIRRFAGPDYVFPGYSYKGWVELAELLAGIAPGKLTKSIRATGGSEAVDIALQAAMVHTKRGKFLSLEDSYHGNSLGTLSIGASENRKQYKNLLANCHKVGPPLDANALDKIETRLKRRDVAAFIMEPISINLGVLIPEQEFMSGVQRLCRRYGTLLIIDEVATGFGRTGTVFASEQFAIEPDIMCLAKAMTSGAAPIGALLATRALARSMEDAGSFYSTYGWHPLSVAAAIANIRYLVRHKTRLLGNVAMMSDYFGERLTQMPFKGSVEVRRRGLAIAVDLSSEDYATKVQSKCRRAGLLITTEGETLLLLPALTIDLAVALEGLDILEECV